MEWYRNDKAAVSEALRRGERPDLATTMASGPLDELVALHEELGIFAIVDELEVQRARAGVADELLLRTLATLPFVEQASLSGASEILFREPAVLLQLGWAPVQIRQGSNGRYRHPEGRREESLPCHPDALRRVGESAWLHAQATGVQSLYQRQLVRGKVYAIDGSGLGDDFRLVALVCVSATRPIIVAWRLLSGSASEKGQEAAVSRSLIEQVLQVAGPQAISLLLADALYADGPLLAWLKYGKGIDALVSLPEDRLLYQDLQGLADGRLIDWSHHRYLRTIGGHKQLREVEVTAAGDLSSWDGFTEAAASYGVSNASLWACLIRDGTTAELAAEPPRALVSTHRFADGFAALQAYRPRWHIEDETYRELKEGWGLEQQRWGRDFAAALGRTTLTCLAFNTAQVYRLQAGERLTAVAIRRLRRLRQRELGTAPAVIYLAGCYGVFALEELLSLLGTPAHESLLPDLQKSSSPDPPT
ncbi:MAG TPA: hypothetical protein VEL31_25670 [Ktedonobacteraceae bacterium]|nr:hypothetical protein [Ktedonobacteraceae bacterium]